MRRTIHVHVGDAGIESMNVSERRAAHVALDRFHATTDQVGQGAPNIGSASSIVAALKNSIRAAEAAIAALQKAYP